MSEQNDSLSPRFPPELITYIDGKAHLGVTLRSLVELAVEERWQARLAKLDSVLDTKLNLVDAKLIAAEATAQSQTITQVATEFSRLWQGKSAEVENIVHNKFAEHWREKIGRRLSILAIAGLSGIASICVFLWASFTAIVSHEAKPYFDDFRNEYTKSYLDTLLTRALQAEHTVEAAKQTLDDEKVNLINVRYELQGEMTSVKHLHDDIAVSASQAAEATKSNKDAADVLNSLLEKHPKQLHGFFEQMNLPVGTVLGLPGTSVKGTLYEASGDGSGRWAVLGSGNIQIPTSEYARKFGRAELPRAQDLEGKWLSSPDPKVGPLTPVIKIN
jgi:hypothetical protein